MINGNFGNFGFLHILRNMHLIFSQISFVRSYRSVQCASTSTRNIANSDSDIYYNRMRSFIGLLCVHVPIEFIGILCNSYSENMAISLFFNLSLNIRLTVLFFLLRQQYVCTTKESNKVILKTIN